MDLLYDRVAIEQYQENSSLKPEKEESFLSIHLKHRSNEFYFN